VTLLISIILRTQLDREHLTPDEYGTILVAAFFATPAMEVLLVLLKMRSQIYMQLTALLPFHRAWLLSQIVYLPVSNQVIIF
jgi:hypothetical protein